MIAARPAEHIGSLCHRSPEGAHCDASAVRLAHSGRGQFPLRKRAVQAVTTPRHSNQHEPHSLTIPQSDASYEMDLLSTSATPLTFRSNLLACGWLVRAN